MSHDLDESNETLREREHWPPKNFSLVEAIKHNSVDYNENDEYVNIASPDKGEAPEFLAYVTLLLDDTQTRRLLYLILLSIWLLPLSIQTLDVVFMTSKLDSNSFCVEEQTCLISFIGFLILSIASFIQFYIIFKQNRFKYHCVSKLTTILTVIGGLLIGTVVFVITFNINASKYKPPQTTCFTLDDYIQNGTVNARSCRVSYFGNNVLGLVVLLLLHFDIYSKHKHFIIRIILMSLGMTISAVCISVNLVINKTYYINEDTGIPLTITCFWVCVVGYGLTFIATSILLPIIMLFKLNWQWKRIIGKICSAVLLLSLFCIQVRTYTEHWLFTLIGLMLIVDIQVISEQ